MTNDKNIWYRFKKGEDVALTHIYYRHAQLLYRYGRKFTSDEELVKDTIQDLFFDLIRTRENLGSTDNIKFYLITSFRRKLFQNINKQLPVSDNNTEVSPEAEIVYSVEYEMINKEELTLRQQKVNQALGKLSSKQREILYYRFTMEFDYEQICELMSLKYDSARKQVFRALQKLKEQLSDESMIVLFAGFVKKK